MATFGGVSGITELEEKLARIVEEYFVNNPPEVFLNWINKNNIKFFNWWDYHNSKKQESVDLIPFNYFKDLLHNSDFNGSYVSLRYLEFSREMSIKILTLGHIPL